MLNEKWEKGNEIAYKYYLFLKNLFPRGWITDVRSIYVEEYDSLRIYFCIKLDAYEKILYKEISGLRIAADMQSFFKIKIQDYQKKERFSFEDMVYGQNLQYWFNEWDGDLINLYLIDIGNNYPYVDGVDYFYSAKHNKMFRVKPPPTRKIKEINGESSYTINPCYIFKSKKISKPDRTSIGLDLDGYKYGRLFATHCFDSFRKSSEDGDFRYKNELSDSQKSIADSISSCGGLLFPSVAISELPATQFGFNVLVLNTEILLDWFKKKQRVSKNLPFYIYNSDGFTGTSASFFGSFSKNLYDECYDGFDIMYRNLSLHTYQNFDVVNGKYEYIDKNIKLVRTEKELVKALNYKKKIMDKHLKKMSTLSDEDAASYFENLGHDKYWLSEVKFSCILDINCFSMCFCPDYMFNNTKAFLDKIGFRGMIIPINLPDKLREKMILNNYLTKYENEYASLVREKMLEFSEIEFRNGMISVENGDVERTDEGLWKEVVNDVKMGDKGARRANGAPERLNSL